MSTDNSKMPPEDMARRPPLLEQLPVEGDGVFMYTNGNPTCKTCRWWWFHPADDYRNGIYQDRGRCRFNPKEEIKNRDDWCGQHQYRDAAKALLEQQKTDKRAEVSLQSFKSALQRMERIKKERAEQENAKRKRTGILQYLSILVFGRRDVQD